MKRKILLMTLGLVVVSQLPFAYRRYRLGRLHNSIQQLVAQRTVQTGAGDYLDYKGVIHVHSSLGGHSTGNFTELISAARANQLDFVIMTEHPQTDFDTAAMTLNDVHAGVLFINGSEVVTADGDRLLLIPGSPAAASMNWISTREVIDKQKAAGGLSIVAYPSDSAKWQQTAVDGVEVYNLFTNARAANRVALFFDGLWCYGRYPDLMFANFFVRPAENLRRWDDAIANDNRRLVATAGNDAHSNIGLSVNEAAGKQLLGIKLDPYERSFHIVRTHALIKKDRELSRESLLEALSHGHCYVSFDLFGDGKGFSFTESSQQKPMGDEIALTERLSLNVSAPLQSRIVLYKNGSAIEQESGTTMEFSINSKGVYRVEAFLDSLPAPAKDQPWILSNPIYVR